MLRPLVLGQSRILFFTHLLGMSLAIEQELNHDKSPMWKSYDLPLPKKQIRSYHKFTKPYGHGR